MRVPTFFTRVARSIHRHPRLWIRLGRLESALLAPDLADVAVAQPVYICGLARSGSTLLLEVLAAHGDAASHRYRDFPFIFTPFWWQLVLKLSPFKDAALHERAHGDRMLVNAASPEAMEEMLWSAFFKDRHDARVSQVLGRDTAAGEFAAFYRRHIQKLLLAAKRTRYVSKGNYHVTRMAYLRQLFPDARLVVPVRDPVTHIASLMRQHRRFCEAGRRNPAVVTHMTLAGHFEFGLNRVPIHSGDAAAVQAVQAAWAAGEELRGWALYWAMIYGFVAGQLAADDDVRGAALVLPYERLCADAAGTLRGLLIHCGLPADEALIAAYVPRIQAPDYYDAGFSEADIRLIRDLTGPVAARFGY